MSYTVNPVKTCAIAIIPARHAATRLHGKPLLDLCGKPMVVRTLERALAARNVSRAVVATDDQRIYQAVCRAGYEAVMTSPEHLSGSDRLAEVAEKLEKGSIIVNVQGDEPLIDPLTIELAVDTFVYDSVCSIVTTCEKFTNVADILSPNIVKVVADETGRALYFSRSVIPFPRDAVRQHGSLEFALNTEPELRKLFRKHTGLYVYRREFLLEYTRWPQTPWEKAESLEQLRALERGAVIRIVESAAPSLGVDTVEDLEQARELLQRELLQGNKSA